MELECFLLLQYKKELRQDGALALKKRDEKKNRVTSPVNLWDGITCWRLWYGTPSGMCCRAAVPRQAYSFPLTPLYIIGDHLQFIIQISGRQKAAISHCKSSLNSGLHPVLWTIPRLSSAVILKNSIFWQNFLPYVRKWVRWFQNWKWHSRKVYVVYAFRYS